MFPFFVLVTVFVCFFVVIVSFTLWVDVLPSLLLLISECRPCQMSSSGLDLTDIRRRVHWSAQKWKRMCWSSKSIDQMKITHVIHYYEKGGKREKIERAMEEGAERLRKIVLVIKVVILVSLIHKRHRRLEERERKRETTTENDRKIHEGIRTDRTKPSLLWRNRKCRTTTRSCFRSENDWRRSRFEGEKKTSIRKVEKRRRLMLRKRTFPILLPHALTWVSETGLLQREGDWVTLFCLSQEKIAWGKGKMGKLHTIYRVNWKTSSTPKSLPIPERKGKNHVR